MLPVETLHSSSNGHEVRQAYLGAEATSFVEMLWFDGIILHADTASEEWHDLLQCIKRLSPSPYVVVVSSDSSPEETEDWLMWGVDVAMRVEPDLSDMGQIILSLRSLQTSTDPAHVRLGSATIELKSGRVLWPPDVGFLTRSELKIVRTLTNAAGRYVSKEQLSESFSPLADTRSAGSVHVLISRLRGKVGLSAIEGRTGLGYRVTTPTKRS